jgi:hypothetical protein
MSNNFYETGFSRHFISHLVIAFVTELYKFSVHSNYNHGEIKQEELENDLTKNAVYFDRNLAPDNNVGERLLAYAQVEID